MTSMLLATTTTIAFFSLLAVAKAAAKAAKAARRAARAQERAELAALVAWAQAHGYDHSIEWERQAAFDRECDRWNRMKRHKARMAQQAAMKAARLRRQAAAAERSLSLQERLDERLENVRSYAKETGKRTKHGGRGSGGNHQGWSSHIGTEGLAFEHSVQKRQAYESAYAAWAERKALQRAQQARWAKRQVVVTPALVALLDRRCCEDALAAFTPRYQRLKDRMYLVYQLTPLTSVAIAA